MTDRDTERAQVGEGTSALQQVLAAVRARQQTLDVLSPDWDSYGAAIGVLLELERTAGVREVQK